ncbi:histone chaperone ASF1 [Microdochium nivale]|nr:histone chaperone ASF1 [Microdochium nivale]
MSTISPAHSPSPPFSIQQPRRLHTPPTALLSPHRPSRLLSTETLLKPNPSSCELHSIPSSLPNYTATPPPPQPQPTPVSPSLNMSVVSLLGVIFKNNPARLADKYELEITFECLEQLEKDLEWKLIYVGSATSTQYDQELDSLLVGPIPVGVNKFVFEADPPNTTNIPSNEVLGVTVVLLTCAYDGREFIRVGYYVNNEYDSAELTADPPAQPILERIRRNILAEKPRVTRFAIKWDSEASAPAEFPPEQPEADLQADEEEYGAEEAEEEAEEEAAAAEEESAAAANADGDADMAGTADATAAEDDEATDDGSVDLEDESEDELAEEEEFEGEGEGEGEAADGDDAMEVDDKPAAAGPSASKQQVAAN